MNEVNCAECEKLQQRCLRCVLAGYGVALPADPALARLEALSAWRPRWDGVTERRAGAVAA